MQGTPDDDPVNKALKEAERAAQQAQQALQHVHKLPSARLKREVLCLSVDFACAKHMQSFEMI